MKIVTIGRRPQNDITINDPKVSRYHCEIMQHDDGSFSIVDIDSLNGTFVNGRRIYGEVALNPSDVVRIGNTTLRWKQYFSGTSRGSTKKLLIVIGGVLAIALVIMATILLSNKNNNDSDGGRSGESSQYYKREPDEKSSQYYKRKPDETRIASDLIGRQLTEGKENGYYPKSWTWKIEEGEISNLKILSVEESTSTYYRVVISMRLSGATRSFDCKAEVSYKQDDSSGWQIEMVKSLGMDIVKTHHYDECIEITFDAGFQIYSIEDGPDYTMNIYNKSDVSLEVAGKYRSYYDNCWTKFCTVVPPNSTKPIQHTRKETPQIDYVERR